MDIKYTKNNNSLTFYLYGELDQSTATKAKTVLDKVISENSNTSKVIFDLSGLSFMDSTGIGLLIGRYKKIKALSLPSFIKGATYSTEKVIEVAGLYNIMPKC